MSPVVASGLIHDCVRDGEHMIVLRLRHEGDAVSVTPVCDVCRMIFLPSALMTGKPADWLMEIVEKARVAAEAPPEAYDALFWDGPDVAKNDD